MVEEPKKEPSEVKPSEGSAVKKPERRCPICGSTRWCRCGYGPEHNFGDDDEP